MTSELYWDIQGPAVLKLPKKKYTSHKAVYSDLSRLTNLDQLVHLPLLYWGERLNKIGSLRPIHCIRNEIFICI